MLGGGPVPAATIRVPADQPTIQAAVDAAVSGDEVVVAPGAYTGAGNKNIHIELKDIAVRSEGGPEVTIIDCEGSGRGFFLVGVNAPGGVVEGLTIANGDGAAGDPSGGGAMFIGGGSVIIRDCVFRGNTARGRNFSGGGGGLVCYNGQQSIEDCRFEGNSALGTGAIGGGVATHYSSAVIRRCHFISNKAVGTVAAGGAVCVGACNSMIEAPLFEDCDFLNNEAPFGGGAFVCNSRVVTCRFESNWAAAGPGGLKAMFSEVAGCTMAANVAHESGGINFTGSTIRDCLIIGNAATRWGGGGGESGVVERCVISGNVALEQVGGLGLTGRTPSTVRACTVVGNNAPSASGIGLFAPYGPVTHVLENIIVATNGSGAAIECFGAATVAISCSDVFGNVGGDWVGCIADFLGASGNVAADPRFCDSGAGDWHLCDDSPCAPAHTGECGLIGALDVGCSCSITVEPATWGQVKAKFQE
jgi:hypothetical protein